MLAEMCDRLTNSLIHLFNNRTMNKIVATIINMEAFQQSDLNIKEYCFCDLIYQLQKLPSNETQGWYDVVKGEGKEYLTNSKTTTVRRKNKMVKMGFLEQHSTKVNCVKASQKWIDEIVNFEDKD